MAATLITSQFAQGDVDPGPVITVGANTTGADFIVAFIGVENTTNAISDSKGNTWTQLTLYSGTSLGTASIQGYYCLNPIVGSGHTFSATGRRPAILVEVWNSGGTPSFGSENGAGTTVGVSNTIQTGSVTLATGDVAVAGLNVGLSARTLSSVDSGFTIDQQVTGNFNLTADAELIASGAGAVNPTFTINANDFNLAAAIIAITISGGGATSPMRLPLLGVN